MVAAMKGPVESAESSTKNKKWTKNESRAKMKRSKKNDGRRRGETTASSWMELMSFVIGCGRRVQAMFVVGMLGAVLDGLVCPLNAYLLSRIFSELSGAATNGMAQVQETAALFVLAGSISLIAGSVHTGCLHVAGYHASRAFRLTWVKALLRQDAAYFDVHGDIGGLATQISPIVKSYRQGIAKKVGNAVKYACIAIGSMVFALISSWRVTLAVLLVLPVIAVASMALVHYNQTTGQRASQAYQKAATVAYSSVAAIRTVHSLNAVPEFIQQYAAATNEAFQKMASYLVKIGLAKGSVQSSFLLMYIVLTMYGSFLLYSDVAHTGCDPSGDVLDNHSCSQTGQELFNALMGVAFTGLGLAQFAGCLEGTTQARVAAHQALVTINRKPGTEMQVIYYHDNSSSYVVDAADKKDEPADDTDSASCSTREKNERHGGDDHNNDRNHSNVKAILPRYEINALSDSGLKPQNVQGSISFKDVYFSYPTRPSVNVFEGLSTEIKAGQTVAFVGPSGGGKSTVVSMIERFYDPQSGSIELDGMNIKDINVAYLRSTVGFVGQEPALFSTSIRQNILYGKPSATQEEIEAAARLASAHDFIMAFDEGYDTQVGYRGGRLSGGQRQRIAIARALVRKPKILLLDEATSALDAESELQVQEALDKILEQEKITTIIIAHRLSTIRNVSQINVIVAGSVVEQGTHDELMATESYYRKLVEDQVGSVAKQGGGLDSKCSGTSLLSSRESSHSSHGSQRSLRKTASKRSVNKVIKGGAHLSFDNVKFAYPTRPQRKVLNGFTLTIHRGETIALVGPSGGGKSTTVGLIERFYDPMDGAVEYMGNDIKSLNVRWYRDQLAYVGQEPILFSDTIARNIAYAAPNASQADIEEACRQANAHSFIMDFPLGYDTPVGEHGGQLSGGQKQRIALARALVRKPQILILDEVTAALDNKSEAVVQAAINKLTASREHTVIMISHRLSTVRNADRIAFVANGQVLECGSHEELLNDEYSRGRYKRLLESSKRDSNIADSSFSCRVGPNKSGKHEEQTIWEALVVAATSMDESENLEMALLHEGRCRKRTGTDGEEEQQVIEVATSIPPSMIKRRTRAMARPDILFLLIGAIGAGLVGAIWPMLGLLFAQMIALLFYRVEACPLADGSIPQGFEYCEDYWQNNASEMRAMSFTVTTFWAVMIAAALLGQVVLSWGFGMANERLSKRTRDSTFTALLCQEITFFDMHEVGSLTSQLQEDTARMYIFLGGPLRAITVAVSSVCTGILISLIFMWPLALVTLFCLPFMVFSMMLEVSKVLGEEQGSDDIADLVNSDSPDSIIVETLLNIRTVSIFTLETTRLEDYEEALEHGPSSEASRYKCDALIQGVKSGSTLLIQMWVNALQLLFGGYLIYQYPDVFTFQNFVTAFFSVPFSLMGLKVAADSMSWSDKKESEESVGRILQLLDRESAIDPLAEDEGQTSLDESFQKRQ